MAMYYTPPEKYQDPWMDVPSEIGKFWDRYMSWRDKNLEQSDKDMANLLEHGLGMHETWTTFMYEEPPEDMVGKIIYYAGFFSQILISVYTAIVGLPLFLLEETVQSAGMGSYLLLMSKDYDAAETYMTTFYNILDTSEMAAKAMATINPLTGGAVLKYMTAARASGAAIEGAIAAGQLKTAETDFKAAQKLIQDAEYGSLRVHSGPDEAEIWFNSVNLEILTPETIKNIPAGTYELDVRKYNRTTEEWDMFIMDIDITAGKHKEIFINIPQGIVTDGEQPDAGAETETDILPKIIMSEVTGDHAIDGDTFATDTGEIIRVLPIDTPETGQPWADIATESLQRMIEDKKVQLRIQSHRPIDAYGRTLAICRYHEGDIGTFQLSSGLATTLIHQDDIYDTQKYLAAEQIAKDRQIGIWS